MQATPWQVAWVTGASSGIGAELAQLLAARDTKVAISARTAGKLAADAAANARLFAYPLDVTDASATAATIARIEAELGPIDLAVLNAGAWAMMDADRLDIAAIRTGVEVNYMGVMHALAMLVPLMVARGRGHIAIVASVAGYRGLPKSAAYGPTKAALINLAETLKSELGPKGIMVSVANPGFVDTPMTRDNPFPMPGIVTARFAAERMLEGLERRRFEIVFPRGFGLAMKLLRIVPDRLFFWYVTTFIQGRGRKKR